MPPSSAPAKRTLATRTIEAWFRKRLTLQAARTVAPAEPHVAFRCAKNHSSVAFRSAKGFRFRFGKGDNRDALPRSKGDHDLIPLKRVI